MILVKILLSKFTGSCWNLYRCVL